MIHLRAFNTVFSSEIPLFGFEPTDHAPDVSIRLGSVPKKLAAVVSENIFWSANHTEVIVEAPGIARYHIANGKRITVEVDSDAGNEATFLMGVPMGACLMQRGFSVLHGSAVATSKGTLLIVGENGAGKSSLAMALTLSSGQLICDNLAAVETLTSGHALHSGPASIRLWEDMALTMGLGTAGKEQVHNGINKYIFSTKPAATRTVPISAIVCLARNNSLSPSIVQLSSMDAIGALMRNHFRGKLAGVLNTNILNQTAAIVENIPIYRLNRPIKNCSPAELADFVVQQVL